MKTAFVLFLLALALIFVVTTTNATPLAAATQDGVTVTLTDEPCAFTRLVTNLPYRATWVEGTKRFEGCYGVDQMGVVVTYWGNDKTVAVIPFRAFKPLTTI